MMFLVAIMSFFIGMYVMACIYALTERGLLKMWWRRGFEDGMKTERRVKEYHADTYRTFVQQIGGGS